MIFFKEKRQQPSCPGKQRQLDQKWDSPSGGLSVQLLFSLTFLSLTEGVSGNTAW